MIIYKATNKINQKVYIGQTIKTLQHRKNQHISETKRINRKNTPFHNAIEKYGIENFYFIIIDYAENINELNYKEQFWIKYYSSNNKKFGYNADSGGLNCTKSKETKIKIGDTTKIKWQNPDTAKRMMAGLRKGTKVWQEKSKERRVLFTCPICGKKEYVQPHILKKKKFCSMKCATKSEGFKRGLILANIKNKKENKKLKDNIKQDIIQWCLNNQNIVNNIPLNKITPTLQPMINIIDKKYNIKDLRSYFICFNVKNKKEFVKALQNIIKNH